MLEFSTGVDLNMPFASLWLMLEFSTRVDVITSFASLYNFGAGVLYRSWSHYLICFSVWLMLLCWGWSHCLIRFCVQFWCWSSLPGLISLLHSLLCVIDAALLGLISLPHSLLCTILVLEFSTRVNFIASFTSLCDWCCSAGVDLIASFASVYNFGAGVLYRGWSHYLIRFSVWLMLLCWGWSHCLIRFSVQFWCWSSLPRLISLPHSLLCVIDAALLGLISLPHSLLCTILVLEFSTRVDLITSFTSLYNCRCSSLPGLISLLHSLLCVIDAALLGLISLPHSPLCTILVLEFSTRVDLITSIASNHDLHMIYMQHIRSHRRSKRRQPLLSLSLSLIQELPWNSVSIQES